MVPPVFAVDFNAIGLMPVTFHGHDVEEEQWSQECQVTDNDTLSVLAEHHQAEWNSQLIQEAWHPLAFDFFPITPKTGQILNVRGVPAWPTMPLDDEILFPPPEHVKELLRLGYDASLNGINFIRLEDDYSGCAVWLGENLYEMAL